jgi:hypothetical protein
MNPALTLILTYLVITAILQTLGFLASWIVDTIDPAVGLLTFVILFVGMFWLAWPIAVRLSATWFPRRRLSVWQALRTTAVGWMPHRSRRQ